MEPREIIGLVLIGVGVLDYVVGTWMVVPQVKLEETKSKLRIALTASSLLTIALGTSFLLGWIGPAA
jgi:uncharacterized membrane protein YidH (DUF202 family)